MEAISDALVYEENGGMICILCSFRPRLVVGFGPGHRSIGQQSTKHVDGFAILCFFILKFCRQEGSLSQSVMEGKPVLIALRVICVVLRQVFSGTLLISLPRNTNEIAVSAKSEMLSTKSIHSQTRGDLMDSRPSATGYKFTVEHALPSSSPALIHTFPAVSSRA